MNKVTHNILNFIASLKNEEYAKADAYIGSALTEKVKKIYSDEYEKIKKEHKKDK
jgi:hypothetical protein